MFLGLPRRIKAPDLADDVDLGIASKGSQRRARSGAPPPSWGQRWTFTPDFHYDIRPGSPYYSVE